MVEAYFQERGERFIPTPFTRGPWSNELQHGGPFSALLAREIERHHPSVGQHRIARITIDMLRPVPLAPLHVSVSPIRMGRQVQWIEARLHWDDNEVARAVAVRIRQKSVDVPAPHCPPLPPPPLPDGGENLVFPFFKADVGYHTSVDVQIARGPWGARGPVAGWIRPRIPLLVGEPLRALERVLIAADASNGITMALDPEEFSFVNPDLSVYLRREARGEWIGLDGRAAAESDGTGMGQSVLHDVEGEIGRSLQALVVSEIPAEDGGS